MQVFIDVLEKILVYVVEICTVGLELAGIVVLVSSAFVCFFR